MNSDPFTYAVNALCSHSAQASLQSLKGNAGHNSETAWVEGLKGEVSFELHLCCARMKEYDTLGLLFENDSFKSR